MLSFDEFVIKHERMIYKLAHKYYLQNYTLDDIVQEIYMVIWKAYTLYDPNRGRSFFSFVYMMITQRMAYLITQQHAHNNNTNFEDIDREHAFLTVDTTLDNEDTHSTQQILWDYIATLPNGQRARYYYIANMSVTRIAEIEGVSHQTISQWLRWLHRKLRKEFPDIHTFL
jgi:RNA polymerase sigma factor (sigma-70 family)